jgi:hypothetical protein
MAKEKSELSKDERKALKAAKKAEKATIADAGVNGSSKHKSDKKDKKDKKKREALAELALNGANGEAEDLNVVVKEKKVKTKGADSDEDDAEQTKTLLAKPIGALVPFAVPLADDKVAKKTFKSVKKGRFACSASFASPLTRCSCRSANTETRCQRSRQSAPKVTHKSTRKQRLERPHRHRRPGS